MLAAIRIATNSRGDTQLHPRAERLLSAQAMTPLIYDKGCPARLNYV
jgi:hypothetical protein